MGWMDFIMPYLLGILDEEIYMIRPEGFVRTGMKWNLKGRLLQSIYGITQAACIWNQKIHAFIKIGFVGSTAATPAFILTRSATSILGFGWMICSLPARTDEILQM